jgi:hypothetical protein
VESGHCRSVITAASPLPKQPPPGADKENDTGDNETLVLAREKSVHVWMPPPRDLPSKGPNESRNSKRTDQRQDDCTERIVGIKSKAHDACSHLLQA